MVLPFSLTICALCWSGGATVVPILKVNKMYSFLNRHKLGFGESLELNENEVVLGSKTSLRPSENQKTVIEY